jgi:hypothetical protein
MRGREPRFCSFVVDPFTASDARWIHPALAAVELPNATEPAQARLNREMDSYDGGS